MNHLRLATSALLGCLTVGTASAHAVQATNIPDAPSCGRCTISLRTIATIGTADPPGSINSTFGIAVDGRGRFWVTQEGEMPMVFDATGKFLQTIGRKGSGPGEFNYAFGPTPIPGDSVLIFDHERVTVIGPDLRPVRTIPLPLGVGSVVFSRWPSLGVAPRGTYGRDMMQSPLQRVSFAGSTVEVLGAFGPDRGRLEPRRPLLQVLAPEFRGGRLWASDATNRYRLTQWTADGVQTHELERRLLWPANEDPGAPQSHVSGIAEDSTGLLWVFVSVRAPTWREAMPKTAPGQREIAARQIAYEKLYKTTIEVIDPRAARVVARQELNEWVMRVLPGGRAVIYTVDFFGTPRGRVVELSLLPR